LPAELNVHHPDTPVATATDPLWDIDPDRAVDRVSASQDRIIPPDGVAEVAVAWPRS
jgi:hypothetical protein